MNSRSIARSTQVLGRRTRIPKLGTAAALAVLISWTVTSAQAGVRNSSALPGLNVAVSALPANLNPATEGNSNQWVAIMNNLAYGGLFHETPAGKITPGLAVKWHYFSTGRGPNKDFEFTLRKDAKFSDGSPVTAQAVVGWLQYFAAKGVTFGTYLGPNPTFEAVGAYTVRIHMLNPQPLIPQIFSDEGFDWGFVASPQGVANPSSLATATDGAGPYMLDPSETVIGDHYTYIPNPYYYDKKAVRFSKVYIKLIASASSRLEALEAGQVDVASGDASTAAAAKSAGFNVDYAVSNNDLICLQPSQLPALKDVRVRQALNYALDRKTISQSLYGNAGKPSSEIITVDANPGLENYYPYNPQKAKALLAAAGYASGFKLTINAVPSNAAVLEAAAKYWQAIGVQTDVATQPNVGAWITQIPNYPATIAGPLITFTPIRAPAYVLPGGLLTKWGTDATVLKLYWGGFKAKDPTALWKQMWTRMTKQAYDLEVDAYPSYWYSSKHVSGVHVTLARLASPLVTEMTLHG